MEISDPIYFIDNKTYSESTSNVRYLNIVDHPNKSKWVVFKSYDLSREIFRKQVSHFINIGFGCIVDNSAELTNSDLVDFLIGHNNLNEVRILTNGFRDMDSGKIDELISKGCDIVREDFFIKYGHQYYQPTYTTKKYPYKQFLMLNGKPKPLRTLLTSLIYNEGLDDYGYISYFTHDRNKNFYFEKTEDVFDLELTETLKEDVLRGIELIGGERILDCHSFNYTVSHSRRYNADFYASVEFVIVSESDIGEGVRFITEKTLKAIQQNKKFILVSSVGMLKETKRVYKELFGVDISHLTDWCDTSYDDIDNDVERVLKIKDIISNILLNSN